jgi:predicted ATPase/DNA-binding CsgD family transcriptional regulator
MNNRSTTLDIELSERELEVLRLLAEGLSNKDIAHKLFLGLETIKWYNKGIFRVLGVSSRTQAAAAGRELGLFKGEAIRQPLPPTDDKYNLPAQVTSFIGRDREIEEVQDLLKIARLVTLTGPPGTGKTRLSLEAAQRIAVNYPDGVIFVSLAGVDNPRLVGKVVASALGLVEGPDQPVIVTIENFLKHKRTLLLLDNFEHLLDAAVIVSDLLASSTQLSILVTSRETLNLSGEHEYLVPPLATPDPNVSTSLIELSEFEAVLLFTQRAKAVQSTFRLSEDNVGTVADICLRLDGLPLPIELAAARIKLFGPEQILIRLENRLNILTSGSRDLHPHQRTLRATIDWSFNLLGEGEKSFFSRLGIFTDGRSIDAVEAICTPGLDLDVIDGLESLLNKSLLIQKEGTGGEPRFFMLETIHEYAYESLLASGEYKLIRRRHLEYFLELVEDLEPGYRGQNQLYLLDITDAEMGNLRSAFYWALDNGNPEAAARIVASIIYFLSYGYHMVEGYQWINQVVGHLDSMSKNTKIRLLAAAGRMSWINGDLERSRVFRQRGLDLARDVGDRYAEAWALIHLAVALVMKPLELEGAIELCEEGLAIMRDLNDKPGTAQALCNLGELHRAHGEYGRAGTAYEESLAICMETGEIFHQIMLKTNLGFVAYRDEEYKLARDFNEESMLQWQEIGSKFGVISWLAYLAGPIGRLGEPERAAQIMSASENLMAEMGFKHHPSDFVEIDLYKSDIMSLLGPADFSRAWAEGETLSLELAIDLAIRG